MKRVFLATLVLCGAMRAEVRLPALISDHMVLQRGVPVRIWGSASPSEAVRVQFQGQTESATAGTDGKWQVFLKPLKTAAPAELNVNDTVVHDVLVGEVWVGSGQSNMEMSVARSMNAAEETAQAKYQGIRMFTVKRTVADEPRDDVTGSWQVCSPEVVGAWSAVGYFFSRDLHQRLNIPVGFIHSSWGGTPAQSWTSRPALEGEPALQFILDDWKTVLDRYPQAKEKYEQELAAWEKSDKTGRRPVPPQGPGHPNTPAGLYNGMIAPIVPYTIQGVIWYQGESNASVKHAYPYRRLFRLMIEDWRRAWGQGAFPFGFVQLANFKANPFWPVLRESQVDALGLRNTGMAVIIDIGESSDIHPKNKQDVGRRLALWARADVYGEKMEYSGPLYREATSEPGVLRVWFDHAGGGLEAKGGTLAGFEIAGADHKFVPAEARIDGETVVVSSREVANPVAVRYAWADDPAATLYNREGLPASPFRSVGWE